MFFMKTLVSTKPICMEKTGVILINQMAGIELATWAGASGTLKALLKSEYRIHGIVADQRLLFCASWDGHDGIVELLSQHGVIDHPNALGDD